MTSRFDPDNYHGPSDIVGMPPSDAIYASNVPVGGSGVHSRGARSRAPGAAIGALVSSLVAPGGGGGNTHHNQNNVQMSQI